MFLVPTKKTHRLFPRRTRQKQNKPSLLFSSNGKLFKFSLKPRGVPFFSLCSVGSCSCCAVQLRVQETKALSPGKQQVTKELQAIRSPFPLDSGKCTVTDINMLRELLLLSLLTRTESVRLPDIKKTPFGEMCCHENDCFGGPPGSLSLQVYKANGLCYRLVRVSSIKVGRPAVKTMPIRSCSLARMQGKVSR